jgi:hypothetical protein
MWKPITATDDQATGPEFPSKLYGWEGQPFPRLSLYVMAQPAMFEPIPGCDPRMEICRQPTLVITCQQQDAYDDWWEKREVPLALAGDLVRLIEEGIPEKT